MTRILLTGATGYVGGRFLRLLEQAGHDVRCLARTPGNLRGRTAPQTEVMQGDVGDLASLQPALRGMEVAYYLVHSLESSGDFERDELRGARNFARAASQAGVRRIVYLGGLGSQDEAQLALSPHLRSRHLVGKVLAESGVQVIELRASIVIGSGSTSFEMVRALTERLPVMITPRWVEVEAQPIAIEDLLDYLHRSLDVELEGNRVFEIGGAERVSYAGVMREYARQCGLRRWMLRVPVLTPRLSSLWLGLVTPLYARIGRRLVESIRHPTVVEDKSAERVFDVRPRGLSEAIERALCLEDQELAESRWCDSTSSNTFERAWVGARFGRRLADARSSWVDATPERVFTPIRRIGGATGWYGSNLLWQLRGALDLLFGGVGMRRGRRDPEELRVGEPLDFWRVEIYEPGQRLRLRAEMKVPGRAWLEFVVEPEGSGCRVHQRALFDPVGLLGPLYWYAIFPLHALVFGRMLKQIVARAQQPEPETRAPLPT